jgi:predicted oxidoreductase
MAKPEVDPARDEGAGFDRGFDGHARRQARIGLHMTPAERLRWLERTMEELRPLVGRARQGRPIGDSR